ncbi:MAG: ABC transporter permease [Clostridia bacterium]|nr:ABC transporter permease [Clostridia bacterium]
MEKRKMKPGAFFRRYFRIMVSGTVLICIILVAIFADQIAPMDPYKVDMYNINQRPGGEHIFGTDMYGRDLFSRVVHGTGISLSIAFIVSVIAMAIGTSLGLLVGYYKWADQVIMRFLEGWAAMPDLILTITLITVLGTGVDKVIIAMVMSRVTGICRLVRQQVLSLKEKEFVECAKASGASNLRVMFKYILPQCLSPLIIRFTSGMAGGIMGLAGLAFLGVGIDPRIPSWGGIINEGRAMVMAYPYQCAYAGVAIMITTLAFSILGDGLRDILDPKLR